MKKKIKLIDFNAEFSPEEREADVLGSYTGNPLFPGEPEQDADDL